MNGPPRQRASAGGPLAFAPRRLEALVYSAPLVLLLAGALLLLDGRAGPRALAWAALSLSALAIVSARLLHRELGKLRGALERAQRAATAGLVTAGFAHEMKNSLTVLLGFAELARTSAERAQASGMPDAKTLRHLQELEREARRTVAQLQDFLGRASGAPARATPQDLNALLQETLAMVRPMARMKELVLDESLGEPPRVSCDPLALGQLVLNLLLNALDFAAARITVETARGSDGWAELSVGDDGPGVPAAERARIFEPFFTTRARGSGLGLSTALEIARDHGGALTLQDGPGARFLLRLPPAPM